VKAVVLESPDGPNALVFKGLPDPKPGDDEILVRIRATSLNYRDVLILDGAYRKLQKQQDLIPLSDAAGDVVEVGSGVKKFKVGDRVTANFFSEWLAGEPNKETMHSDWGRYRDGMLCQLKVFKAHHLVKTPQHLSDAEAATLPCAGLTAWSSIIGEGEIKPGELVLTQGTGGVSLFALQYAKMAGAEIIATSSSNEKLAKAQKLGADHLINYKDNPNWGEIALNISHGKGVDHVVELGGTQTLKQSLIAIRPGGTLGMIGVLSGATLGDILLPFIVSRKVRMQGVTVGSAEEMAVMCRAIALHKLKPVVDKTFPFEEAKEAFMYLKSGAHFGNVCIGV